MAAPQFLVIQTAFIGDAILATAVLEKLHQHYPQAAIDLMVRAGNEGLFKYHPFLRQVLVWQKQGQKYRSWWRLLRQVRATRYQYVINLQRFASMGLFAALSGGQQRLGFNQAPFSWALDQRQPHSTREGQHEVERNQRLIAHLTDPRPARPRLYPAPAQFEKVKVYQSIPYVCIAPTSVWFTKQWPAAQWAELMRQLPAHLRVYLLGGPPDAATCQQLVEQVNRPLVENLAGQLGLLESAALMQGAVMNYVNDSAPLHLASALNAPVCAVFCSTVPGFGFTPLADLSHVVETAEPLPCRPCGLHGHRACPQGHFKCATGISIGQLLAVLPP
ncbi:MAG: glycosyltransferase family 9 protein [Bernardetiaceae bacterium]|nr:glycosyltransferase family 9 protein [Bernardetiaceae bacterium]